LGFSIGGGYISDNSLSYGLIILSSKAVSIVVRKLIIDS